jgi:mono/diheme cytochrome c family protein
MNQPITRRLAPAAILALMAVSAHAQDANVAAGHAFAREACSACHVVEPEQQKPRLVVIGPAFRDIANTRGMTATALRVFLTTSHPKMPNLILTPEEIAGVSAYILSLRDHPPP